MLLVCPRWILEENQVVGVHAVCSPTRTDELDGYRRPSFVAKPILDAFVRTAEEIARNAVTSRRTLSAFRMRSSMVAWQVYLLFMSLSLKARVTSRPSFVRVSKRKCCIFWSYSTIFGRLSETTRMRTTEELHRRRLTLMRIIGVHSQLSIG